MTKQYSGNADTSWAKQLVKTGSLMCGIALFVTLPGLSSSKVATATMETCPLSAPMIFAPGIISGAGNDGTPTFSPDGRTLYFYR